MSDSEASSSGGEEELDMSEVVPARDERPRAGPEAASGAAPAADASEAAGTEPELPLQEQQRRWPDNVCANCGRASAAPRQCAGCGGGAIYCSDECALSRQPQHGPVCALLARLVDGKRLSHAEQRKLQILPKQLYTPVFSDEAAETPTAPTSIGAPIGGHGGWHGGRRRGNWIGPGVGIGWGAPRYVRNCPYGYCWHPSLGCRPCWRYGSYGVPYNAGVAYGWPGVSAGIGIGPFTAGVTL